jgi:glyoxylase-like metal-dependent hydrolase (beta-lactamase superfamily II)
MVSALPAFAQVAGVFGGAGSIVPAAASDLSGNWAPAPHDELVGNPALVEYYGVPINEGARAWGLAWSPSRATLPEHQCQSHLVGYIYGGPLNLRIWEEKDPQSQRVIAIKQYISTYEQQRTIWMDDRPHPSANAPHTWMGFSTGKWDGDVLTVYTTHIKTGELRRNGLMESDEATLVEHFFRYGNLLTHVSIITDPLTLTEPFVRSQSFTLTVPEGQTWLYPCEYVDEIADRPRGEVPNYLPGKNPFLKEHAEKLHIPLEAALGGAETMYPEFHQKMKQGLAGNAAAKTASAPVTPPPASPSNGDLDVLHVQGNVYMIAGAGANIAVQVGDLGVLVVDTGLARNSEKVLAAIRKLSDKPIQYVVNSALDADRIGGNEAIRRAGVTITGANVAADIKDAGQGAQIVAHQNILDRISAPTGKQASAPDGAWPTETYVKGQKEIFFNEEPVAVIYQPKAHTDGDSLVLFRRSDVVATGDIFTTTGYPFIDLANGGSIQGEIDALNNILDITIPKHDEEGGTYVIPGRGRICDENDVLEYRDMVTIIRDRVRDAIKRGMTLDQVKKANFTIDFDTRFGPGDSFVEAVYKSLNK